MWPGFYLYIYLSLIHHLLSSATTAATTAVPRDFDNHCDQSLFGTIKFQDCRFYVHRLAGGWPFAYRPASPTLDRVFQIDGQPPPFNATPLEIQLRQRLPLLMIDTGTDCPMALLAIQDTKGRASADMTSYPDLRWRGNQLLDRCAIIDEPTAFTKRMKGGVALVGRSRRLALVMYSLKSPFAKQMSLVKKERRLECARSLESMTLAADEVIGATDCRLTDSPGGIGSGTDEGGGDGSGALRLTYNMSASASS